MRSEPAQIYKPHRRSVSQRIEKPLGVVTQLEGGKPSTTNPPSPATSVSSVASSPSHASMAPSTPGSGQISHGHSRNPSEFGAIENFKHTFLDGDVSRRYKDVNDRAVTCLLAEDKPIAAKIIEILLIRLGCRVVAVSEAISVAHGDTSKHFS